MRRRLKDQSLTLELTQRAKDFLVEKGFDEKYGARPLKRALQQYVEDELAEILLVGGVKPGTQIIADSNDELKKLKFEFKEIPIVASESSLNEFQLDKILYTDGTVEDKVENDLTEH